MLQIKNGKIQTEGVAFSLPDGFFIERIDANACSFRLGNIFLQMGVEESPASVEEILLDGEHKPSEIFNVTHNDLQGKAVFSYASEPTVHGYEERFALKSGKQLFVLVEAYGENAISNEQMQALVNSVL